jgi:anion-transporting  ArsA/GET3 family ATPase
MSTSVTTSRDLLSRQLHFVCGKGGVGKSVVSVALARAFAARGLRVLLAQINAADSHSALLGGPSVGDELLGVAPGITAVNITPAAAMKEYALMTLRFEAVYRTVFENRITKVFLRFVPSLNEMVTLGKLWFHAEETRGGAPRFDRIVVDAPSTGHGLKLLQVARIVHDAARVGPMAEKTGLMAQVVEDPRRTALHVVTLPEELPVNEAFELCRRAREARIAPLGLAFVNQVLPSLFSSNVDTALRLLEGEAGRREVDSDTAALGGLLEVAEARRLRERAEEQQRVRVRELALPVIEGPRLVATRLLPTHVLELADVIGRSMETA